MYSREGDAPAEPKTTAGRRPPEAEPKLDSGSAGASPSIIDARILGRFCRLTLCVQTVFSILPRDRDLVARLGT